MAKKPERKVNVRQLPSRDLLLYDSLRRAQNATWKDINWDEVELVSGPYLADKETHIKIINGHPGWKEVFSVQRRDDRNFCDVHFITDEGYVPVHSIFLQGLSPFLDSLLNQSLPLSCKDDVVAISLPDVKMDTLKLLLTLLYSGSVIVSGNDRKEVNNLIKLFQMGKKVSFHCFPCEEGNQEGSNANSNQKRKNNKIVRSFRCILSEDGKPSITPPPPQLPPPPPPPPVTPEPSSSNNTKLTPTRFAPIPKINAITESQSKPGSSKQFPVPPPPRPHPPPQSKKNADSDDDLFTPINNFIKIKPGDNIKFHNQPRINRRTKTKAPKPLDSDIEEEPRSRYRTRTKHISETDRDSSLELIHDEKENITENKRTLRSRSNSVKVPVSSSGSKQTTDLDPGAVVMLKDCKKAKHNGPINTKITESSITAPNLLQNSKVSNENEPEDGNWSDTSTNSLTSIRDVKVFVDRLNSTDITHLQKRVRNRQNCVIKRGDLPQDMKYVQSSDNTIAHAKPTTPISTLPSHSAPQITTEGINAPPQTQTSQSQSQVSAQVKPRKTKKRCSSETACTNSVINDEALVQKRSKMEPEIKDPSTLERANLSTSSTRRHASAPVVTIGLDVLKEKLRTALIEVVKRKKNESLNQTNDDISSFGSTNNAVGLEIVKSEPIDIPLQPPPVIFPEFGAIKTEVEQTEELINPPEATIGDLTLSPNTLENVENNVTAEHEPQLALEPEIITNGGAHSEMLSITEANCNETTPSRIENRDDQDQQLMEIRPQPLMSLEVGPPTNASLQSQTSSTSIMMTSTFHAKLTHTRRRQRGGRGGYQRGHHHHHYHRFSDPLPTFTRTSQIDHRLFPSRDLVELPLALRPPTPALFPNFNMPYMHQLPQPQSPSLIISSLYQNMVGESSSSFMSQVLRSTFSRHVSQHYHHHANSYQAAQQNGDGNNTGIVSRSRGILPQVFRIQR